MDDAVKSRRMDSLHFQIGELERAGLKEGEEESLTERRTLLRNAERLISAVEGPISPSPGTTSGKGPPLSSPPRRARSPGWPA